MGFYTGKAVLVAGGTGTIGLSVVNELVLRGATVIVASLDSREYAKATLPSGVTFVRADLSDSEKCLWHTEGMDVVFDMVGIKGSTLTNTRNYSRMFVSYLRFQTALMDACAKNSVPNYLFAGSVCSYPQMTEAKHEDQMWSGMPTQNDKYGGLVKRVGELQASAYHEDGSWHGARIIRLSNVYGPGDDFNPETAQVIPALIARAVNSNHVKVQGDGTAIRDFIYVKDAAYWACEAAAKLPTCTPTNIASGHGVTIKDVCNTIAKFLPVTFEFVPNAYSGDPVRILSTDRAKELLNFKELTSLEEGIEESIKWYKEHRSVTTLKGKFYGK